MAKRNMGDFSEILKKAREEGVPAGAETTLPAPGAGRTATRVKRTNQAVTGGRTSALRYRVPVSATRLAPDHDRDYAALNADNCSDLIESFKTIGQQLPVIAREIEEGPYDEDLEEYAVRFEIIVGARRRWVADHLNQPLLVETRVLDDREAFLLRDIENREREDLTDYERASSYLRALERGDIFRTQEQMASAMGVKSAWLSSYLSIARAPAILLDAFGSRANLGVRLGTPLNALYSGKGESITFKGDVENVARNLAEMQRLRAQRGEAAISAAGVLRQLQAAAEKLEKRGGRKAETIMAEDGSVYAEAKVTAKNITLTLARNRTYTVEDVARYLGEFLAGKSKPH